MLLEPRKAPKRQSFSIESLAVSSHVEHAIEAVSPPCGSFPSRSSANHMSSAADHNLNISQEQRWLEFQEFYNARGLSLRIDEGNVSVCDFTSSGTIPEVSTSTPKMPSPKRRRLHSTSTPPSSSDDSAADDKNATDDSSLTGFPDEEKCSPISTSGSSAFSDNESTCSDSSARRKKVRTAFTGDQLKELERRYKTQKYLTASDRTHLANTLKLKEQQVKTWYQNRRMKEKRQQREDEESRAFCLPTGGVDISQLTALGIRPPPFHLASPSAATAGNGAQSSQLSLDRDWRLLSDDIPPAFTGRLPSPVDVSLQRGSVVDTAKIPSPYLNNHATYALGVERQFPNGHATPKDLFKVSAYEASPQLYSRPYNFQRPIPLYPGVTNIVTSMTSPMSSFAYTGQRS